jgi:hypothetical protein
MATVKLVLLVPLNYNDGTAVPAELHDRIKDELFQLAGGYTIAGTVAGAYRMGDGSKQVDESLQVWVGVGEDQIDLLRRLVARFAEWLGQEAMYLERSGGTIEFVTPQQSGETHEREEPENA